MPLFGAVKHRVDQFLDIYIITSRLVRKFCSNTVGGLICQLLPKKFFIENQKNLFFYCQFFVNSMRKTMLSKLFSGIAAQRTFLKTRKFISDGFRGTVGTLRFTCLDLFALNQKFPQSRQNLPSSALVILCVNLLKQFVCFVLKNSEIG